MVLLCRLGFIQLLTQAFRVKLHWHLLDEPSPTCFTLFQPQHTIQTYFQFSSNMKMSPDLNVTLIILKKRLFPK